MNSDAKKEVSSEMLDKLKKELNHLKKTKRREIADKLRHAISFGDLKENAAYHEAKDEQAFLEGRIAELEQIIRSSVVSCSSNRLSDQVSIGSKIKVVLNDNEEEITIVSGLDSDPLNGKISADSPMGKALLGKKEGQETFLETPAQEKISIKIKKIN